MLVQALTFNPLVLAPAKEENRYVLCYMINYEYHSENIWATL